MGSSKYNRMVGLEAVGIQVPTRADSLREESALKFYDTRVIDYWPKVITTRAQWNVRVNNLRSSQREQ